MYAAFKHNGKLVSLDLEKPVRVKLGPWADADNRMWIYSTVDFSCWQDDETGAFKWHCLTLSRERLMADGTFQNQEDVLDIREQLEQGDCVGPIDIDEIYSNMPIGNEYGDPTR